MSEAKPVKTYIIRHKETKELWQADSGKSSWKQPGHAKSAWKGSSSSIPEHLRAKNRYSWEETCRFDDQDEYEVIELKPESRLLKKKQEIKDLFEYYHNGLYNPESEHYRFEHFWEKFCELVEVEL